MLQLLLFIIKSLYIGCNLSIYSHKYFSFKLIFVNSIFPIKVVPYIIQPFQVVCVMSKVNPMYLIPCVVIIEADAELKEVKHLKSMLEQQAIQMAEQSAHYDNMMMQMLSYITLQSAQSSSDH